MPAARATRTSLPRMRRATRPPPAAPENAPAVPAPDVVRSSRLATYAMWWMRILLTDSVIESRGVIVRAKNPKVRKALFSLPLAIRKLDIHLPLTGSDIGRIAAFLGIAEREIEEALVHAAGDVMLDEPIGDGSMLRGEVIPDERADGEDGILARLASAHRWSSVCEALMAIAVARPLHPGHPLSFKSEMEVGPVVGPAEDVTRAHPADRRRRTGSDPAEHRKREHGARSAKARASRYAAYADTLCCEGQPSWTNAATTRSAVPRRSRSRLWSMPSSVRPPRPTPKSWPGFSGISSLLLDRREQPVAGGRRWR